MLNLNFFLSATKCINQYRDSIFWIHIGTRNPEESSCEEKLSTLTDMERNPYEHIVFHTSSLSDDEKNNFTKYLMGFKLKKSPFFCIGRIAIIMLFLSFLSIWVIGLTTSFFLKSEYSKIIFMGLAFLIVLCNYLVLKYYFHKIHSTEQTNNKIICHYEKTENGDFQAHSYRQEKYPIESVLPMIISAYFFLIFTFTFYTAQTLPTPNNSKIIHNNIIQDFKK